MYPLGYKNRPGQYKTRPPNFGPWRTWIALRSRFAPRYIRAVELCGCTALRRTGALRYISGIIELSLMKLLWLPLSRSSSSTAETIAIRALSPGRGCVRARLLPGLKAC
jgi:hypothetical protein